MQFTEQKIQEKISNALGDIWAVKFIEHTQWSDDVLIKYYDNMAEAMKEYNDTNNEIKTSDFFISATAPIKINNWLTIIFND